MEANQNPQLSAGTQNPIEYLNHIQLENENQVTQVQENIERETVFEDVAIKKEPSSPEIKYCNTQDFLEIGETTFTGPSRPEQVTSSSGLIKEEDMDPVDAQMYSQTEKIKQFIWNKREDRNETNNYKKMKQQLNAGTSIIPKIEDEAANSTTPSDIKKYPCTSSKLQILKEPVASWRVILHRLPTNALPSNTTSGGPVACVDERNNNKFNAMEDVPRKDARNDVAESEEACKIGLKDLVSKKLITNYTQHNLKKKKKNQTETKKLIHNHDSEFKIPAQKKYEHKNYICNHCQVKFNSKIKLREHMAIHSSTSKINHSYPDGKNIKCVVCDYAFSRLDNLKRHMLTHADEKPFKCDLCNYSSYNSYYLKRHMRTHFGEKPFKCHLCDYAALESCALKRHIRKHTGEKPFKCDSCDYRCSHRNSLNYHKKRHHGASSAK